jgi:cytochrome P450
VLTTDATDDDLEFDPFSKEMMDDPYPVYRRLRRRAPVYWNRTRSFWALTRYAETRWVLKNDTSFSTKQGVELDGTGATVFGGSNFGAMDPPEHSIVRRIIAPAFTPGKIRALEEKVREVTDDLIDAFVERGKADFSSEFGWPQPIEMISYLLGVPEADRPWVSETVLKAFRRDYGDAGLPTAAMDAAGRARDYFAEQVAARRSASTGDIFSMMATSAGKDGRRLSDADAGGISLLLFAAGIITTGSFLSNSLNQLAEAPDQRRKLVERPELLPRAVEELWRLESPASNTARTALEDLEIGGQQVRKGDRVAVFIGSANRDEAVWENSETLDVEREPTRSMVFGDGIHFCLGAHLARLEGRIGLERLLARIPEYTVVGPIVRTDRVNERGIVSLPVEF